VVVDAAVVAVGVTVTAAIAVGAAEGAGSLPFTKPQNIAYFTSGEFSELPVFITR
jgi:hypothetical protein